MSIEKIRNRGLGITGDDLKYAVEWRKYKSSVSPTVDAKDLAILTRAKLLATRRALKHATSDAKSGGYSGWRRWLTKPGRLIRRAWLPRRKANA
jgi:hypothetical protein